MVNFGLPTAVSGAPDPTADARSAVRAAFAMADGAAELARRFAAEGRPPIRLRVGIATGSVVVGTLGSADRLKYTTVGAAVNTAARLESFEREGFALDPDREVARILIAEPTRELLREEDLEVDDLGVHLLRGKGDPERIFRVRTKVSWSEAKEEE
jgi:adenylate cyclase